ncbi:MAG: F-type H+-transporting ATPase subunit b [Lentimonas sp.]|jgi:F-type H+-transporting ATPase subunit b
MLFSDPKFWLSISFLLFIVLMIKYAAPLIIAMIDNKSKQIANDIEQAKKMKIESEKLLESAKKYHEESLSYCQDLIKNAHQEGEKLLEESHKSLESEINRKTHLAKERITSEKEKVIRDMKSKIIDTAIKIIENKATKISDKSSSDLSAKFIANISKTIH